MSAEPTMMTMTETLSVIDCLEENRWFAGANCYQSMVIIDGVDVSLGPDALPVQRWPRQTEPINPRDFGKQPKSDNTSYVIPLIEKKRDRERPN